MTKYVHVPLPEGYEPSNAHILIQAVEPWTRTFVKCTQKCPIKDVDLQKHLCANTLLDGVLGLLEAYNAPQILIDYVDSLSASDVIDMIDRCNMEAKAEAEHRKFQTKAKTVVKNKPRDTYMAAHDPETDALAAFLLRHVYND